MNRSGWKIGRCESVELFQVSSKQNVRNHFCVRRNLTKIFEKQTHKNDPMAIEFVFSRCNLLPEMTPIENKHNRVLLGFNFE